MVICLCNLGNLKEARLHVDRLLLMDSIPTKTASIALLE
ncbi:hypothetical protein SLEP1_g28080 [Rubroshorea leprosula]|uniref:Uncharacterized protein n=1 Tax=Rubroshorea leprosula TaxID=152421 RepID=A0AAV5JZL8_9ROSI|nr:hypothetical protein SLEP1_g28080 [Rubroshorea leprosula]